jgi:hypothetical protein
VEKAITLYLSTRGELNGWWHPGQLGSPAGGNASEVLLWLISKVCENRKNKEYIAVLIVDISAAFANTSRDEDRGRLRIADPGVAKWVDIWLDNR